MSQYSLIVENQSCNNTNFAIFQQMPDVEGAVGNVFPLAWLSKYAYTNTTLEFQWSLDYNFVWSRSGILVPGIQFTASQCLPADPKQGPNSILLDYDAPNDTFHFEDRKRDKDALGSLVVHTDTDVPVSQTNKEHAAAVGIGMSGHGTFVCETQPNMTLRFTPKPKYYLIAGNFKQGEVLDIQTIFGRALEIQYKDVFQRTAILKRNNQWELL
ncbi:MAG: hypothetical protein AAF639_05430 [Chloroflexota bacterium]